MPGAKDHSSEPHVWRRVAWKLKLHPLWAILRVEQVVESLAPKRNSTSTDPEMSSSFCACRFATNERGEGRLFGLLALSLSSEISTVQV
jgi:hypothetical protein